MNWPPDVGIEPYYSDDRVVIFNADCRDVLPRLPKCDLLLTDPPYGIGADHRQSARADKQHGNALAPSRDYGETSWDAEPPDASTMSRAIDSATHAVVFGGNYFDFRAATCWFVWDKDNGDNGYADCELAWTNLPGAVRKVRWKWHGMLQENMGDKKEQRRHPTQKPVAVMKWCIERAGDAKTILDPFAGSCTTAVAAKQLGRRCICIELEERYCEIGAQRCRQGVLW